MGEKITVRNQVPARIENAVYSPHRIAFTVDTPAPCLVVVAQSYYPNWRARIGSQVIPLWRANYAFQAFQVPAGRQDVTLTYVDGKFRTGLIITLITLAGMILAWVRWKLTDSAKT
jgi:uncharacterized membrane protein YfhO